MPPLTTRPPQQSLLEQRRALLRQVAELELASRAAGREQEPADRAPLLGMTGTARQLRLGRQVVPLGVIGLLWSAGMVAQANPGAAALYLAVAVLVWWVKTRRSPNRRLRGRYRTVVTVCGASWLLVATTTGAGAWQTALLVAGGYALAAPWWYRNRVPVPAPPAALEPEPESEPEPEPEPLEVLFEAPVLDLVVAKWDELVSADGALAGARLTNPEKLPGGGTRYLIQLRSGKQTFQSAKNAQAAIASALGRSLAEVSVYEHPSGKQDLAFLLVTGAADNVFARLNRHPGYDVVYDPATGYAGIGVHGDEAWARWGIHVPDWGVASGAVFGDVGTGKSALLEMIALTAAYTGVMSVWGGDPTGGGAIPGIINNCAWPARNRDEILDQFRALAELIETRVPANGLFGINLHVPTADEPGVLLIVDELHKLTKDKTWAHRKEFISLLELASREGRKAGVGVVVADQGPGLPNFGDVAEIRSNIMTLNAVALRLNTDDAQQMVPGLAANPAKLPRMFPDGSPTSGLGYLVGIRTAPMRTFYVAKEEWAPAWSAAPVVEFDELAANALGDRWHNRHGHAVASKAKVASRIGKLSPALLAKAVALNPELAEAVARQRVLEQQAAAQLAAATGPGPAVRKFVIPPAPRFRLSQPAAAPPEPDVLRTPGARRIWELIGQGVCTPKELIEHTGLSESHVHAQLDALENAKLITKVRRGRYERAA